MVVEPDILARMVIAEYLRECGYKVVEGVTADDVMAVLSAGTGIELVLAEVQLAGSMDGFALAQWIRANHPNIDVVLTSGVDRAADKAGDLCDEGPLEKPYHPQERCDASIFFASGGEPLRKNEGRPRIIRNLTFFLWGSHRLGSIGVFVRGKGDVPGRTAQHGLATNRPPGRG
jgi:CheY-like chemotaxis protein